jgi:DNA-binding helix-hairpin-helix protein with protein kinase domain
MRIRGHFSKPKAIREQKVWEALLLTYSEWVEEVRQRKKERKKERKKQYLSQLTQWLDKLPELQEASILVY